MQSSEQWRDGGLLFERLLTLPNYEKCALALHHPGFSLFQNMQVLTFCLCCTGGCAHRQSHMPVSLPLQPSFVCTPALSRTAALDRVVPLHVGACMTGCPACSGPSHRPRLCQTQGHSIHRWAAPPWRSSPRQGARSVRPQSLPKHHALHHMHIKPEHSLAPVRSADLYEFDPEQTRKAPFRVRVRTTLPFLGSRFESVRTITISDEVPGVSCRHTLSGFVKVRLPAVVGSTMSVFDASSAQAVRARSWQYCLLAC